MKRRSKILAGALILLAQLPGCTQQPTRDTDINEQAAQAWSVHEQQRNPAPDTDVKPLPPAPIKLQLKQRMIRKGPAAAAPITKKPPRLYTLHIDDLEIGKALNLFARANTLNIIADPDVTGKVTVHFHDLPLELAMQAILDAHGYYWVRHDNLIQVHALETRKFTVDYIRMVRSGKGSSQAQLASGGGNNNLNVGTTGTLNNTVTGNNVVSGGTTGISSAGMSISQTDDIRFWDEFEQQLKALVSEQGRLIINRMAGVIQITDRHARVEEVASFLANINQALHREVEIQVKILEVTLDENAHLGIDWNAVASALSLDWQLSTSTLIATPAGGFPAKASTLQINAPGSAVINALQEQGDVNVISQPRIRTLNNQPALIKVGTDQTFFRIQSTTGLTAGATTTTSSDIPQVVTVGLVLSVTPQISEDQWVMLDISPVITRLAGTVTSSLGSTAPLLDIKQSSSLVRVRNGEMVVIGGLILDELSDTERKVPGLSRIPVLGNLFKGTYKVKQRKELIIFMTPRLVGSAS